MDAPVGRWTLTSFRTPEKQVRYQDVVVGVVHFAAPDAVLQCEALAFCARASLSMLALARCTVSHAALGNSSSEALTVCARTSLQMLALARSTRINLEQVRYQDVVVGAVHLAAPDAVPDH